MSAIAGKPLVIGAAGQVGAQIVRLLGEDACDVTCRRPGQGVELHLDLATLTLAGAEWILGNRPPSAIYCAAGMNHVEGCESASHLAYGTNTRGPEVLALVAATLGIPFVYFSSDYVFDGKAGPYSEDDPAGPLSVYGDSKRQGELAVLAACPKALILRTTVVYGEDRGHKNFVYTLMRTLAARTPMRIPRDQISTPTYNRDLASTAIALVARKATGVFHVCGRERMDRLEFAGVVATQLSLDTSLLVGVATGRLSQRARRPLSAGLSTAKLQHLHPDLAMRSIPEALGDCRTALAEYLGYCVAMARGHYPPTRKVARAGIVLHRTN